MQQSGFVCCNYKKSPNLAMARLEGTDENDSGWFIGCLDPACDHDNVENLSRVSLYEITNHHPQLRPWLSFPNDSVILLEQDKVEVRVNDELKEIEEGSFLAELIG